MLRVVSVGLILGVLTAPAQIVGGGFGRIQPPGSIGGGFGSIMFPGTGVPRGNPNISGHIPALNRTIRGVPPPGRPNQPVIVPVPVMVGGYGYGYGYAQTPNVTVINAPQPSPTVIINQNYAPEQARPALRTYPEGALPAPEPAVTSYQAPVPSYAAPEPSSAPRVIRSVHSDKPTIYLIAMRDGTVYSAYAYWIEGDTLHYVTTKHAMNMASVSLVDTAVTTQLNEERGVTVKLTSN